MSNNTEWRRLSKRRMAILKDYIRSDPFVNHSSIEVFALMSDGEPMCHKCTTDNYRLIASATLRNENSQWKFIGLSIEKDADSFCCHCRRNLNEAEE